VIPCTGARRLSRILRQRCIQISGLMLAFLAGASGLAAAQTSTPPPPPASGQAAATPASPRATASTPPDKVPEFAVASIKPNKSGSMGVRIMFGNDGFSATNTPLKLMIREAYGVNDDQIAGAPAWTDSARFDIDAKVDGADVATMKNLSFDQRKQMICSLLTDRFGLKTHTETKDLPVYALVIGKGGSKLQQAKPGDTYPNGLKGPDGQHGGAGMMMFNGNGQLTAQGVPISNLVRMLSQQTGRTVIDKTGLTGDYDFTLQLPPMKGPIPMPHAAGDAPAGADDAADDSSGPSIFTALQDQLGLKLESQRAPLPLIVIDHVEQPSEN